MELREALTQISEIRRRVAQTELFRGYRAVPVAFSGLLALATAAVQMLYLPYPADHPSAYIALWVGGCLMLSALIFSRFRPPKVERCSFCGRAQTNPGALMKGHGVAICGDCVRSNVEQMKSEARRQLEATADGETEAAPAADPAAAGERPYPSNGRTYPTDDGDEGVGKKRIQL